EMDHWREFLKHTRAAGPQTRPFPPKGETRQETPDEFQKRMDALETEVNNREKEIDLQRRRNAYEVGTTNKPPLEKASQALRLGLVKQALEVLAEQTDPAQLEEYGMQLALRLLLATGQAYTVLENPNSFRDPLDHVLLAAAVGDYHKADLYLEEM